MRLYHLLFIPCFAVVAIASCDTGSGSEGICDAGANVFCRCRGGGAGTKKCNDTGDGFGACETESGTCEEVEEDPDNPSGGPGGNTTAPPGEYMGPCTTGDDSTCKDGNVCPMGYCTKPCATYQDCGEGNDCIGWPPGSDPAQPGLCMPYCIRQSDCEDFGMASRCGYTSEAKPAYDVVVCADWGDNLQLPPNGYPPSGACDSDDLCHLGFDGVERVCGPSGCTDGCHDADDCSDPEEECSSVAGDVGICTGGMTTENGDDCPGIPVTLTSVNPDTSITGDTANAIPPSEHACASPCYASLNPPSEELVYQLSIDSANCSFSAPCTVTAYLSTTDQTYDPQLYVRELMCSEASYQVTHSDEIGGGVSEIMEWCVFDQEDFWIFVDGWQGSTGTFQLELNLASGCSG